MADQNWTTVKHQLQAVLRSGALGSLSDGQLLIRFLEGGDPAAQAFEILVARHGPMVLSVCRQILGATHDADDAFQATFLVLVRKASAIRNRDSVASWLHGVARRISLRSRQHTRTRRLVPLGDTPSDSGDPLAQDELIVSVHEEIARLPEHYRVPVLLCEIGGQTHAQAAAQLNCPIGTVSGRLSRAKTILKERIARRGIVASAVAISTALASRPAKAGWAGMGARSAALLRDAAVAGTQGDLLARSYLASRLASALKLATACMLATATGLFVAYGHGGPADQPTTQGAAQSQPARVARHAAPARVEAKPEPIAENSPVDQHIIAAAVAPDGKSFALIRANSWVTLCDIEGNRERLTYRGHRAPILSLAFSPDGTSITSSDSERTLKVWGTASGLEQLSTTIPLVRETQTASTERPCPKFPRGS